MFINGNGVEGVLHPLRFTQLEMLPLIDEWKPSSPAKTPFFFGVLAIDAGADRVEAAAAAVGALAAARRRCLASRCFRCVIRRCWRSSPRCSCRKDLRSGGDAPLADRTLRWVALAGAAILVAVRAVMPLERRTRMKPIRGS